MLKERPTEGRCQSQERPKNIHHKPSLTLILPTHLLQSFPFTFTSIQPFLSSSLLLLSFFQFFPLQFYLLDTSLSFLIRSNLFLQYLHHLHTIFMSLPFVSFPKLFYWPFVLHFLPYFASSVVLTSSFNPIPFTYRPFFPSSVLFL